MESNPNRGSHYGRASQLKPRPGYHHDDASAEEIAAREAALVPLTDAVRGLLDAVVRTQVPDEELDDVRNELEALTKRLRSEQLPGPHGVRFSSAGDYRNYGNPVVGRGNAIAPPVLVHREPDGLAWSEFDLGAAYEGPPSLVHGGVSAMILDQLLGEAASAGGTPGMTGTLTVRYRHGTPLGRLRAEAKTVSSEGIKSIVRGTLSTRPDDGSEPVVCVEAEGLFILPRWAREQLGERAKTEGDHGSL